MTLQFLLLVFYTLLFLILAVIDLRYRLIPDRIIYPAIVVTLALVILMPSAGMPTFSNSLIGSLAMFIPFYLIALFGQGGIGWGDVKMATLVGLITGFPAIIVAFLSTSISGGVAAGYLLSKQKGKIKTLPLAPFLSLGAIVALYWGDNLVQWYLEFGWLF